MLHRGALTTEPILKNEWGVNRFVVWPEVHGGGYYIILLKVFM